MELQGGGPEHSPGRRVRSAVGAGGGGEHGKEGLRVSIPRQAPQRFGKPQRPTWCDVFDLRQSKDLWGKRGCRLVDYPLT